MVIDLTGTQPVYFPVGGAKVGEPLVSGYRDSSNVATTFSGGSGESVFVTGAYSGAGNPLGHYRKSDLASWDNLKGFSIVYDPATSTHGITNGVGIIAKFSGLDMQLNTARCSSLVSSGGAGDYTFNVFLGSDTGSVTLSYNALAVPNQFIVNYNGSNVIDTGLVGSSGVYNGVTVTTVGAGSGTASFTKSSATPTVATVTVKAPYGGSAWEFDLGCPGGASDSNPSQELGTTEDTDKLKFTAYSTAYGNTLNGSSFTLDVVYENSTSTNRMIATSSAAAVDGIYNQNGLSTWIKPVLDTLVTSPYQVYIYSYNSFPSLYLNEVTDNHFSNGTYFLDYVNTSTREFELSNSTGVVSYLPANGSGSPNGNYIQTAYGAATYGYASGGISNYILLPSNTIYFSIKSNSDGSANIVDGTDIVASIDVTDPLKPSGIYESTTYGSDEYNLGNPFFITVGNEPRMTAAGWFYIEVNLVSGVVDSVDGPFFKNSMPNSTTDLKIIPIAYSDGAGKVDQIHDGPVIFR